MRLVMGGESLETQLTGIGQYTYNLALELRKRPEILDFKFQMHGRLLKPDHLMASHDSISNQPQADQLLTKRRQILSKIRTVAAQNLLCGNGIRMAYAPLGKKIPAPLSSQRRVSFSELHIARFSREKDCLNS